MPKRRVTQAQLNQVNKAFRTSSKIVEGRWKYWPKISVETTGYESGPFQYLHDIFKDIVDECRKVIEGAPIVDFFINTGLSANLTRSVTGSRPDGYLLRVPLASKPVKDHPSSPASAERKDLREDIAVSIEYMENHDRHSRTCNEDKIIWSMHHVMRRDPCRRFTFSITIENTHMRVWHSNRSIITVAKDFDFFGDHDALIKVVTSFAFAKEAHMGWDPTLRRRTHGGQYVFDIDVHAPEGTVETFTADKIIYSFEANTRVFRAKASDGKTVVIKDVWRDQNGV
ncbi:hypothetical protein HETIRDRAFT_450033 [Heterobasidion irregulare TC 32-1]|uniref:Fungal-type protein kinase domain-containing protein n=1 Tax=Heterobasidion irregulare (strain TC 32-1) TaxID=747525 RepID=W4KHP0_HETIT|nr:uncharacterized protein HETIRDRAFT_450033 [Heterobasidion irregulare TC 32-1]ETW84596.1 hypothetical protein HETIRDRAFT_450033 [Heterobasidion irregulare TC 32-1]